MDLNFLAEADVVTLKLEQARRQFELAKAEVEAAKRAHEELMNRADEHGIPKAKLKKLTEERLQLLMETGLFEKSEVAPTRDARPKKAKTPKVETSENSTVEARDSEGTEGAAELLSSAAEDVEAEFAAH